MVRAAKQTIRQRLWRALCCLWVGLKALVYQSVSGTRLAFLSKANTLLLVMDVFSGVLSGSAFAGHVTGPYDPSNKPADVGHFLVAIKPDLFVTLDDFRERMDYLYRRVVDSDKAAGVDRIYFPGEIEQITEETRRKTGIPYVEAEVNALNEEADKVGKPRIKVDAR